jgi:hypothetical protein
MSLLLGLTLLVAHAVITGEDRESPRRVTVSETADGVELVEMARPLVGAERDTADDIDVEITWIRHALSCANVNDQYSGGGSTWAQGKMKNAMAMRDPALSNFGIKASKATGEYMREAGLGDAKYDIVASSQLLRAQETATLTFPGHEVLVLPFVGEEGSGIQAFNQDNTMSSSEEQQERMQDLEAYLPFGTLDVDRHLFEHAQTLSETYQKTIRERIQEENPRKMSGWLKDVGHRSGLGRFNAASELEEMFLHPEKPDMDKALRFIARNVVPKVQALRTSMTTPASASSPTRVIRMAIVSHSNFLKAALPCSVPLSGPNGKRRKPVNNEALNVKYRLSTDDLGPVLVEKFPNSCVQAVPGSMHYGPLYPRTFEPLPLPSKEEGLCEEDYERCNAAYPGLMQVRPCADEVIMLKAREEERREKLATRMTGRDRDE